MKRKRIAAVVERHLYDIRHNFDRLFDVIYWPVLDIIMWGFLSIYLSEKGVAGTNFRNFLLGAVILWRIFYSFSRDIAVAFLEEIWSRNLLNMFASPLSIGEYVEGLLAVNLFKVVLSFTVTSLLALLFYGFNIFPSSFSLLPYILNLLLFSLAIGFLVAGLILRYTSKIQTLAWSFAGLFSPISGVFYPISILPKFLQNVAWFLPSMHSFEAMRQILAGGGFSPVHFWWGFILNWIYLGLSILFFKKIFEIARNRGLLVKLE